MEDVMMLCQRFLAELIAVDTSNPPGNEEKAAAYIAKTLGAFGIGCDVLAVAPGRANVVSHPQGEGPYLLLTGHLDVVPAQGIWQTDPFEAVLRHGSIYGRGACDMKGGIACMMAAAVQAVQAGNHVPFRLAFVTDEELHGAGTRALIKALSSPDPRFTVIGEPTMNEVCIAHRGAIRIKALIHGVSCHAGTPDSGVNAIDGAGCVIRAVGRAHKRFGAMPQELLPPSSMACTMLSSGIKDNVIPDECALTIDCRPCPGQTPEDFIRALMDEIEREGGLPAGCRIEFETYINVPAGGVAADSNIVQWASANYRRAFGAPPAIRAFPACCDLSQFTLAGHAAILYGPGSLEQAHTVDEFVTVDELAKAVSFYSECLRDS